MTWLSRTRVVGANRPGRGRGGSIVRIAALPLALILLGASAPPIRPARIVSLNLCADNHLLLLADRWQIAALTLLAGDAEMSALAPRAAGIATTRGSAEDVLALRPDLVLVSPFGRRETVARLRERGVAVLEVPPADDLPAIRAQIVQVAAAVGHPARGRAAVAAMDRILANVPARAGRGATAAYYQRRGFLTGTGTLIDALMARVGLVNLAARLGRGSLSRISLEEMALARPDYLIVESATDRVRDQGVEMLHHPVLDTVPRLRLPQAWTVCGGPAYALAARSLARQLAAGRR